MLKEKVKREIERIKLHSHNQLSVHPGSVDAQDKLYLIRIIEGLEVLAERWNKARKIMAEGSKRLKRIKSQSLQ